MNFQGIAMLRRLGMPAPRTETLQHFSEEVDLDPVHYNNPNNATILVFDQNEAANQNPLLERGVRKYRVTRNDFGETLELLVDQMRAKGVSDKDIFTVVHQSYAAPDISYSGRFAMEVDKFGAGFIVIDAVESLRQGKADFQPSFLLQVPIQGGRPLFSAAELVRGEFGLPQQYVRKMLKDVRRIPGNPHIDFEVYADNGELFYHDMFLAQQ